MVAKYFCASLRVQWCALLLGVAIMLFAFLQPAPLLQTKWGGGRVALGTSASPDSSSSSQSFELPPSLSSADAEADAQMAREQEEVRIPHTDALTETQVLDAMMAVVPCFYKSTSDYRFKIGLDTARAAREAGIPIVFVDGSDGDEFSKALIAEGKRVCLFICKMCVSELLITMSPLSVCVCSAGATVVREEACPYNAASGVTHSKVSVCVYV
jgi:hypothetical protein